MSVLCYDFMEGASYMPTVSGLIEFFSDERPDVLTVTTSVACDNEDDR